MLHACIRSWMASRMLPTAQAGLHSASFKMLRQIMPLAFTLQWKIFVINVTCNIDGGRYRWDRKGGKTSTHTVVHTYVRRFKRIFLSELNAKAKTSAFIRGFERPLDDGLPLKEVGSFNTNTATDRHTVGHKRTLAYYIMWIHVSQTG